MNKVFDSEEPVAVVVPARGSNSMGIIRSLALKGIPVLALDTSRFVSTLHSRYCRGQICPDPVCSETKFVEYLSQIGQRMGQKAVLFVTDDFYLVLTTKYHEELERYYHFSFLSQDVLWDCIDKRRMYRRAMEADVPCPRTYWPVTMEGFEILYRNIRYPCIIKPISKFELDGENVNKMFGFIKKYKSKAVRAQSRGELVSLLDKMKANGFTVMVQEEILGGAERLYTVILYVDRDSRVLATFGGRKLRQIPPDFGGITLGERTCVPEVVELGLRFVKALGFQGICNVEFKEDPRDGQFKLIEINGRPGTFIFLPTACGINFPYIAYLDLLGAKVPETGLMNSDLKWLDIWRDTAYFLKYRKGSHNGTDLSLWDWLNTLRGQTVYAFFSLKDPLPFVLLPLELLRMGL